MLEVVLEVVAAEVELAAWASTAAAGRGVAAARVVLVAKAVAAVALPSD